MFYTVLTASRSSAIGNGLMYESDDPRLSLGSHVGVPLRKSIVEGIVVEVLEKRAEEAGDIKKIHELLGDAPLLPSSHVRLARWMSQYYCCTFRQALGVLLPPPPWKRLQPPVTLWYRLVKGDVELRGSKQKAIVEYLKGKGSVSLAEIKAETGATPVMLKSLLESEVIEMHERTEAASVRFPFSPVRPVLSEEQRTAYEAIVADTRPTLLFGVTGSGKTEVYATLIADAIDQGKTALMLMPEILLTEFSLTRFEKLLPRAHLAVLHSGLTLAQRRKEWLRIQSGEARVVIGSRSALFAPLNDLGVIILDEEHEWTYKNEQSPRYHARETAEELARLTGATLVLGSATPSLEAWSKAKDGRYLLARLPKRFEDRAMPTVRIVDLATVDFGNVYPFSPPLLEAIQDRLTKDEQSVLFLNRRGAATALLCLDCRRRVVSPSSQLPFAVHNGPAGQYLFDHTSGLQCDVPASCPSCQSTRLFAVGAGTQKIEQILKQRFPAARILRADSDTLGSPEEIRGILDAMRERRADILLGTQSVVKGLDLPLVTLAAVLVADVGLSLPHFRAGERVFQLLTQLSGRSGRASPGEVIIQTFRPNSPEVLSAAAHDAEGYLEKELRLRQATNYPPAVPLVRLIFRGDDVARRARAVSDGAKSISTERSMGISISVSPTLFGGGNVWHVLLRGMAARELLALLSAHDAIVDIDPLECV